MDIKQIRQRLEMDALRESLAADATSKPVEAPEYKNETPEWFNYSDRAVVKNLAHDNDESIKYLQSKYPDAEFTATGNEIYMRKKGEKDYGKLDPSGMKDWLKDAGDLAYDAFQGVAEGVGALGGAALGTTVAPVAGTFAGAAAGGAAASGVASTAKEALRKHFGLTDEMSAKNIATDAAVAGVMPYAFRGAGKALGYAAKEAAPWLYSKATGLSKEALKDIAVNGDALASMSDTDVLGKINKVSSAAKEEIQKRQAGFRDEFTKQREGGFKISIDPVVSKLDELIAAAREKRIRSGSNYLAEDERSLMEMKDRILAGNDHGRVRGIHKQVIEGSPTQAPKQVAKFDTVRGGYVEDAPLDYKPLDVSAGDFQIDHMKGDLDIQDYADIMQGIKGDFIDYAKLPGGKIGKGADLEERAGLDLVELMRNEIANVTDGASGDLSKRYAAHLDDVDFANKSFKNSESTERTLNTLRKGKNRVAKGKMQRLPEVLRTAQDTNKALEIHNYFNPGEEGNYIRSGADVILGKSPLSKVLQMGGAGVGYLSGGGYAGSAAGGLIGRKIGDLLTSPEAVKFIAKHAREKGISTEAAMRAIANDPKLMAAIYGTTQATVR